MGPGRILGQVRVRLKISYFEPCRVYACARAGEPAGRTGFKAVLYTDTINLHYAISEA